MLKQIRVCIVKNRQSCSVFVMTKFVCFILFWVSFHYSVPLRSLLTIAPIAPTLSILTASACVLVFKFCLYGDNLKKNKTIALELLLS